jgi:predicted TIM-barrel enzyme
MVVEGLRGWYESRMNRIETTFGVSRVLLPVIHPISREEALRSVRVAHDAGVKGVFLIDQGMSTNEVLALIVTVREQFPSLWVGVNLLGCPPPEALRRALDACGGRIDGIWSDDASIAEGAAAQPEAQAFIDARRKLGWAGLYFGGVAFKYRRAVAPERLHDAAVAAAPFMDVVCTSGPGTGQQADVAKIVALAGAMGPEHALALASGVTDANVESYLPYVAAFLVGTGIEKRFGVLDAEKVAALQARIAYHARSSELAGSQAP